MEEPLLQARLGCHQPLREDKVQLIRSLRVCAGRSRALLACSGWVLGNELCTWLSPTPQQGSMCQRGPARGAGCRRQPGMQGWTHRACLHIILSITPCHPSATCGAIGCHLRTLVLHQGGRRGAGIPPARSWLGDPWGKPGGARGLFASEEKADILLHLHSCRAASHIARLQHHQCIQCKFPGGKERFLLGVSSGVTRRAGKVRLL